MIVAQIMAFLIARVNQRERMV